MAFRVGNVIFSDWQSIPLEEYYTDTFIFRVSCYHGLPPAEYARVISLCVPELRRLRRSASIWVKVEAPGLWYPLELRENLHGLPIPIAVTKDATESLSLADFSVMPWWCPTPTPNTAEVDDWKIDLNPPSLACLRVMARLTDAFTSEVASLADISITYAREGLMELQKKRLVFHTEPGMDLYSDKFPFWTISKYGVTIALRSWGVSPGLRFNSRFETRRDTGERHRRVGRLWFGWLKKSLPYAEIWAGWSEVRLPEVRSVPDGLAWGRLEGRETLFWLEVESGHRSSADIVEKISKRFQIALRYVARRRMRLIFAVLGMPWVQNAAKLAFMDLNPEVAVLVGDWKEFGALPPIQWGRVKTMD